FDLARDGCMKAQTELPNVECVYIGPAEHTESEQVQIVQDLITKGIDGIAVSSSNAAAMAVALKAAKEANIPVVTCDSDLLPQDTGERAAFIGTHNYDIGVNLAKIAQQLKPKRGQIVFVSADTLSMQMAQLKDGLSDGQVGQKPFEMGRLAMHRLLDLKNGKTLKDPEYTGLDVCTKDTADTCMK